MSTLKFDRPIKEMFVSLKHDKDRSITLIYHVDGDKFTLQSWNTVGDWSNVDSSILENLKEGALEKFKTTR